MRFVPTVVLAFSLILAGCGGIQIQPTPPVPPVTDTLAAPTLAQIRTALGENNQYGMVPGFPLGEIIIPVCTQEDGSPVDFPVTYSMSDLPVWLDFDQQTRALSLNVFAIVPPDANTAAEVTYTCTDDSDPTVTDSQTFVANDLDGGGAVDGKEYEFGEVPLVGLAGYFQLNRDNVDLYRPSTNPFLVPTGIVSTAVGLDPTNAADDTEDFDGDEGIAGGGNNAEEILNDSNIFAHVSQGAMNFVANHATKDTPVYVVSADFDGDDDKDLAVANWASDNVSVLVGDGTGAFTYDGTYASDNNPFGLNVADLNADGDIDLATSNDLNSFSVLLGNGDGTFAPNTDYALPVGYRCRGSVLADLDSDGDIDAAVGNDSPDNIAILLNSGTGIFTIKGFHAVGNSPNNLTAADFDGDGDMDLAVANRTGANISILLGNGDGTFGPQSAYASQNFPQGISAADFDGDGNIDIATANSGSDSVSVFLGDGDGTFEAARNFDTNNPAIPGSGDQPTGVIAVDIDGDGIADLVTANLGSDDIAILFGDGDGTFTLGDTYYAADLWSITLVSADFDGDGKLDVAVSNRAANTLTVLLND